MAETTKKFLDLTGLTIYDGKIKEKIAKDIKVVQDDLNTRKVKDTADSTTITWAKAENGTYTASVAGDVVVDAEYQTVKTKATQSAAAWTKFLDGSNVAYPDGITPALKDLATDANARSYASTAQTNAITEAGKLDKALETKITTEYQSADTTLKNTLIGVDGDALDKDTIWGTKKYADEKAGAALTAATNAKTAADAAQGTADTALANAATADSKAVAAQNTADAAKAAAKVADDKAVAAQGTADEIKNTTIPAIKSELEGKITANTNLIDTTKAELIGGDLDTKDSNSIKGAKLYADDLASGLSTRIDSIVAGGVAFKGVVTEMPSDPKNGDLIIIGKEGGITVGSVTYKKDYEYIYSDGAWYELGDSDKNAKAIAAVETKANTNATAIQRVETEYKAADTTIKESIKTLSDAAVKSIAGGNSTYVTVSASAKDETGKVTLTVSDTIAATFDTQASVDGKISAAKDVLIGTEGIAGNTIWGAKKYTDEAVKALGDSFVAITADEINKLFA